MKKIIIWLADLFHVSLQKETVKYVYQDVIRVIPPDGVLRGNVTIDGDVTVDGSLTVSGNLVARGSIAATKSGTVIAEGGTHE